MLLVFWRSALPVPSHGLSIAIGADFDQVNELLKLQEGQLCSAAINVSINVSVGFSSVCTGARFPAINCEAFR
jgi:hypothetical protein